MKALYNLYYGILAGLLAGFIVSMLQSYLYQKSYLLNRPLLISVVFFGLLKFVLNDAERKGTLDNVEVPLKALNVAMIVLALGIILLAYMDWFAFSNWMLGVAFGVPNLIALFYWNKKRLL